jgi:hypothetical protein
MQRIALISICLVVAVYCEADEGRGKEQALGCADGRRFLDEVQRAYAAEDYTQLDTLFRPSEWKRTSVFSEKQWSALAHRIADHLQFGELPAGYQSGESWSRFVSANQHDRVLVRRDGINRLSVERLRGMAVAGQISDPEMIPKLIEALEHPSTNVRRYAYYALESLTKRHFGDEVWSRGVEDAVKEPKYIGQWREWWLVNQSKRPILSKELQDQVRQRIVALHDRIRNELGPKFPGELGWMRDKRCGWMFLSTHAKPLLELSYAPALRSTVLPLPEYRYRDGSIRWEDLPFLTIEADFNTPGQDRPSSSMAKPKLTSAKLKLVHEEMVDDTDIRIQIFLASPNGILHEALAELMER